MKPKQSALTGRIFDSTGRPLSQKALRDFEETLVANRFKPASTPLVSKPKKEKVGATQALLDEAIALLEEYQYREKSGENLECCIGCGYSVSYNECKPDCPIGTFLEKAATK